MQIRVGYELEYSCPQPTPMILTLNVHSSRVADLVSVDHITTVPAVPLDQYRDGFGNWCSRLVAPEGDIRISTSAVIRDSGLPDEVDIFAQQHPIEDLPANTLVYLLGSRYCETDRLSEIAWQLFHHSPFGWERVQAICNFVHTHIRFGYEYSSPTKTAWEVFNDRTGVCRDFAHLAIAFCRCMNIPARYCTGYLSDIGMTPPYSVMDFAAWMEVYLGGRWHIFDPRNNERRCGRILIAQGRDAADAAISNTFGANTLKRFIVHRDEIPNS
ncbi:transglutaminase-like domain-containing protein [Chrysiogenes arsenatis]|uniref:transglutaminase-like domain-containing protein n=1 Tax=Chrysiogenes arsenatis TaxID=309797 RepID=UPI000406826E|nr:transglutaminase family protein [Chrysiogenes arsenatis]